MAETIIVAGALAQRPGYGGHTWVFLQYLLGFRRLGFDVVFLDRLEPGMCFDSVGAPAPFRSSENIRYVDEVMERFGLSGRWSVLYDGGRDAAGLDRGEVVERASRSVLLINVMGYLDDEEVLAAAPVRVFLDIDPGFGQMWHELGLARPFEGHDRHVTVGTRVGQPGCLVPECGLDWLTTLPPVELSQWAAGPAAGTRFTSVGSWRGAFDPIEYEGKTYGLRAHEFRRFVELPRRTSASFEVALDIDDADAADRDRLSEEGWELVDPRLAAGDPWRYRAYVQGSAAELMIAKNLYVETRSGWVSDRSACYLACARPVLAQNTGLDDLFPSGEGLVLFSTPDDAAQGVEEIGGDYERHSRAARELAEEHFAADRVLTRLLDELAP
jgi:Glycosyl transferases group 1